ncbi:MAG TPA: phosphotransferase [Polyangia bacterium]|nr:phosphotransferase [Polyangia bacterium]
MPIPPAEQLVSPSLAAALIDRQFPELRPARAEPAGEGWDNFAFRVNGSLMFRFPRRELAVDWIVKEHRFLPRIAPLLPLPAPIPKWLGHADLDYPWPFLGHEMVPGETACGADLNDRERAECAAPLARFLAALHRIPVEDAPPDRFARLDAERLISRARTNFNAMQSKGLISDIGRLNDLLKSVEPLHPEPPVLVHGDMYVRHLLLNESRKLCGVIDWGDLHASDPAIDLAIAHSFLPPSAHAAFRAAYGPIPDVRWRWAKWRALYHSTVIALMDDAALTREGLRALAWIQEL